MKKVSKTEAELKKSIAFIKKRVLWHYANSWKVKAINWN